MTVPSLHQSSVPLRPFETESRSSLREKEVLDLAGEAAQPPARAEDALRTLRGAVGEPQLPILLHWVIDVEEQAGADRRVSGDDASSEVHRGPGAGEDLRRARPKRRAVARPPIELSVAVTGPEPDLAAELGEVVGRMRLGILAGRQAREAAGLIRRAPQQRRLARGLVAPHPDAAGVHLPTRARDEACGSRARMQIAHDVAARVHVVQPEATLRARCAQRNHDAVTEHLEACRARGVDGRCQFEDAARARARAVAEPELEGRAVGGCVEVDPLWRGGQVRAGMQEARGA